MPVDHLPGGDEVKGSCPCWARRSALRHDAVEKALDIAERYVAREKGFSQPAREQEGQLAAFHLLVVRHVPDERRAIGGDPGIPRMGLHPAGGPVAADAVGGARWADTPLPGAPTGTAQGRKRAWKG